MAVPMPQTPSKFQPKGKQFLSRTGTHRWDPEPGCEFSSEFSCENWCENWCEFQVTNRGVLLPVKHGKKTPRFFTWNSHQFSLFVSLRIHREFTPRFWVSNTGQGMAWKRVLFRSQFFAKDLIWCNFLERSIILWPRSPWLEIFACFGFLGPPWGVPRAPKAVLETSPAHEAQGEPEKLGLKGIGGVFRRVQGCSRVLKGDGFPLPCQQGEKEPTATLHACRPRGLQRICCSSMCYAKPNKLSVLYNPDGRFACYAFPCLFFSGATGPSRYQKPSCDTISLCLIWKIGFWLPGRSWNSQGFRF
jgi:hypothetical protein